MSATFAHPPHLSSYTAPSSLTLVGAESRDPHSVPVYDDNKTSPVLYLPPLLSSLPDTFPPVPVPFGNSPVVTQTRLPDIDPVSLSLHKALHYFRPKDEHYARHPYDEAFNWDQLVLPEEEEREWYCVVFRSKRKAGSEGQSLYEADRLAHEEAVHNGGLLLYWYGIPDQQTGLNLATCIWQSRKHAIAANSRPHHIQAMKLAAASYEIYDLERYVLRKVSGSTSVSIEPFTGGEVGW
ncbi:UPF0643 protein [Mycena sanguinolenta]|uniref:UPF0643 protein n=1 Tax=Mycena sanguinolenta TaxID=230812 RepID=A0A8H7DJY9_9AGAR|nr:UPF0643 protein [Mycena sanguinolenta]